MAALALLIAIAAIANGFYGQRALEASLHQQIERDLKQKASMLANRVNSDRSTNLQNIISQEAHSAGARATAIDAAGKVLADSQQSAESMEGMAGTPEFAGALGGEVSVNTRSLGAIPILYAAAPVAGGAVRLAYPLSEVGRNPLSTAALTGFGIALLLALISSAVASILRTPRTIELSENQSGAAPDSPPPQQIGFTMLQEKQNQLETLLNSMQEAVIAIGPDERVQWANVSMERLVFLRIKLNAPVVETVRDPDFLNAVRQASETRAVVTTRATSIIPGHTFDVTAAPLPGGGAVVVLRDLTETERVEKTRRDFIANVSHELRTPLTSIQGYAETLLDSAGEQIHSRDFLEIIRKNAARMSRLTEDLLTLARVESGEQRFDIKPVSTTELLDEAIQNVREVAGVQGIEIQVDNKYQAQVKADPEAVQQIFSNLIENAIKYASSGKVVALGAAPIEGGVEFYVRDFGPGIPSEHLPRLFERFYRVDRARSRESGGTGLGLAIAKHIVLAHGGTIRAESELNHGSTFLFTLPLAL